MGTSSSAMDFTVWGVDQQAYGPVELPTLVSWVQGERIKADTWIFDIRSSTWRRASEVPELRMFFTPKPSPAAPGARKLPPPAEIDPRALRRIRVLGCMTDEELSRFAQFMETERVLQGQTVIRQGESNTAIYLVLEGEFRVRVKMAGEESVLAKIEAGDFFGDIALFDHGPRSADVMAETSGFLLKVSAAAFDRLAKEAPELATPFLLALGKTLASRIRVENKHHCESVSLARVME